MSDPTAVLQAGDFEALVGESFHFAEAPHALVLDRVESLQGARPDGLEQAPFILIFRGPKPGPVLPEGLADCRVDGGASFRLYLSPIHTPQPDRQEYQSVFN